MANPVPNPSLHDALRVAYRHKGKAILFLSVVMALTLIVTFLTPKAYRSEGRLLLRVGWENARLDPVATLGEGAAVANVGQIREFEINTVVAIITSRAVIEKLVDAIGPAVILGEAELPPPAVAGPDADDGGGSGRPAETGRGVGAAETKVAVMGTADREKREAAINHIVGNLLVEAITKSNVILVSFDASSPELSRTIVAKLMDIYVGEHVRINRVRGARDFLAQQTQDLNAKLADTERRLLDLKNENGIVSPTYEREELSERMGSIDRALSEAAADAAAAEARIRVLNDQLAELPDREITATSTGPNKALAGMREQLYHVEMKEQELLADSTEDFFELQQIRDQKDRAKAILDEMPLVTEETEGPSHRYEQVHLALLQGEPALAAFHAKIQRLQQQRDELAEELRKFNEQDLQINRLEREVELQGNAYRQYVANLEQARIDQALEDARISSITIVQPASFEMKPIRPRKLVNLAVGLMLGVFGGIGLAFLAEYVRSSGKNAGQVERE